MKMSIDWHKSRLKNSIDYAKRKREEAERLIKVADDCDRNVALLKAQIDLAEKEGKDGFDADKYALRKLIGV